MDRRKASPEGLPGAQPLASFPSGEAGWGGPRCSASCCARSAAVRPVACRSGLRRTQGRAATWSPRMAGRLTAAMAEHRTRAPMRDRPMQALRGAATGASTATTRAERQKTRVFSRLPRLPIYALRGLHWSSGNTSTRRRSPPKASSSIRLPSPAGSSRSTRRLAPNAGAAKTSPHRSPPPAAVPRSPDTGRPLPSWAASCTPPHRMGTRTRSAP